MWWDLSFFVFLWFWIFNTSKWEISVILLHEISRCERITPIDMEFSSEDFELSTWEKV